MCIVANINSSVATELDLFLFVALVTENDFVDKIINFSF
jgi:hypothetical protein